MSSHARNIVLIAHDIRSAHNIGSLLRTADGMGLQKVYITGISPYPMSKTDTRLPHIAQKLHKQIQKTALGAESSVEWEYNPDILRVLHDLQKNSYTIAALEQNAQSLPLHTYIPPRNIAIILGNEVEGINDELIKASDICLEISMFGAKESFNVAQAAAIAMYHLRFYQP